MNNFSVYLERLREFLLATLTKIEESAAFERLVIKFESLEPRQQKWWRVGGVIGLVLGVACLYLIPLMLIAAQKSSVQKSRDLLNEIQSFNSENSVVRRPAPRPQGWQGMPSANLKDMESSLDQFTQTIGIPLDFITLKSAPPADISLAVKELSLRQAVAIIFQMDGWYPGLQFESLTVSVNPTSKDLLELDTKLRYDEQLASAITQNNDSRSGPMVSNSRFGGNTGGTNPTGGGGEEDFGGGTSGLKPGVGPNGGGNNNFDDDFGDTPTPPLNFEDDL